MRVGHANNRSLPASPTGSRSSVAPNPCVDAADACTADERCHRLRTAYVAQCLGRAAPGGCPRARCRRALRHFFARGPPALTHALLFCPCGGPACAERRRQTFVEPMPPAVETQSLNHWTTWKVPILFNLILITNLPLKYYYYFFILFIF